MSSKGKKNKQPGQALPRRGRSSGKVSRSLEPQPAAIQQQGFGSGWLVIAIILIVLAFAIVMAVMKIIGTAPSIKPPLLFRPVWISYTALGIIIFTWMNWIIFTRRKTTRYKTNLCITCGYSLETASQAGTCPECGNSYTLKECESAWKNFYRGQQQLQQGG